jgi:hypothetical protein
MYTFPRRLACLVYAFQNGRNQQARAVEPIGSGEHTQALCAERAVPIVGCKKGPAGWFLEARGERQLNDDVHHVEDEHLIAG